MASLALSDGRVLELHEPTFGEELHVVAMHHENLEELMYAKCALIVPQLSREEIAALNRKDGRALIAAVARVWDPPPEDTAPLGSGSVSSSTDSHLSGLTR